MIWELKGDDAPHQTMGAQVRAGARSCRLSLHGVGRPHCIISRVNVVR